MRGVIWGLLILLAASPALAKDSESQAKGRFRGWLKAMAQIEARVKPVQPIHIPAARQTREQEAEILRRIEFLDHIQSKEIGVISREIASYRCPDSAAPAFLAVRRANENLFSWVNGKFELQNAGVNNPGLEGLRKNEPLLYEEYRQAYQAAEAALK